MAQKTIVQFGDPILRKVAKPVIECGPETLKLLDDMAETLYAKKGRAGLASPQVGVLKRVVVMDCGEGLVELINPEITEMRGKQTDPEACLSFPGYTGIVTRADFVRIKYQNRQGEEIPLSARGFLARCLQHEIDHLDGILYIDRIDDDGLLYNDHTLENIDLLEVIRMSRKEV